jgi:hypothetical protein
LLLSTNPKKAQDLRLVAHHDFRRQIWSLTLFTTRSSSQKGLNSGFGHKNHPYALEIRNSRLVGWYLNTDTDTKKKEKKKRLHAFNLQMTNNNN